MVPWVRDPRQCVAAYSPRSWRAASTVDCTRSARGHALELTSELDLDVVADLVDEAAIATAAASDRIELLMLHGSAVSLNGTFGRACPYTAPYIGIDYRKYRVQQEATASSCPRVRDGV